MIKLIHDIEGMSWGCTRPASSSNATMLLHCSSTFFFNHLCNLRLYTKFALKPGVECSSNVMPLTERPIWLKLSSSTCPLAVYHQYSVPTLLQVVTPISFLKKVILYCFSSANQLIFCEFSTGIVHIFSATILHSYVLFPHEVSLFQT